MPKLAWYRVFGADSFSNCGVACPPPHSFSVSVPAGCFADFLGFKKKKGTAVPILSCNLTFSNDASSIATVTRNQVAEENGALIL